MDAGGCRWMQVGAGARRKWMKVDELGCWSLWPNYLPRNGMEWNGMEWNQYKLGKQYL